MLMDNISSVALLLIGVAAVGIILGHEMACLTSDKVIDEIFSSERPYLSCVLYFTCTLINCAFWEHSFEHAEYGGNPAEKICFMIILLF